MLLGPTRVGLTCRYATMLAVSTSSRPPWRGPADSWARCWAGSTPSPDGPARLPRRIPGDFSADGFGSAPMPFTRTDVTYLRNTELDLDHTLATVARTHRTTYVDTYTATESHNACQPEAVRWIEPSSPTPKAAPVHPNATGQQAMARLLTAALRADRFR